MTELVMTPTNTLKDPSRSFHFSDEVRAFHSRSLGLKNRVTITLLTEFDNAGALGR